MNLLVLHNMGYPAQWRKSVADLELSMERQDDVNTYITHNATLPFPGFLKEIKYDGIILWSTFLDARHFRSQYERVLHEYDFIKRSDAVKIALPQDDYYCPETLDEWMTDWNVDVVYNVIHEQTLNFFPKYLGSGGHVKKGFTGYVSEEFIAKTDKIKAFSERKIDVGYRASAVPLNLNKLVKLKATIGEDFKTMFSSYGLNMDISVREQDTIYGNKWHEFIQDCKFVIATNSGSSLVMPNLYFREKVEEFVKQNPGLSYEVIKERFFRNQPEELTFTAISPRNIEAALLGSCQINTTWGNYSGIILPWEHYIPLATDCSNHAEVSNAMKDENLVNKLITNSREAVLSEANLRLTNLINDMLNIVSEKRRGKTELNYKDYRLQYLNYASNTGKWIWGKFWLKSKARNMIGYFTK